VPEKLLREITEFIDAIPSRANAVTFTPARCAAEAEPFGTPTEFGSVNYVSSVKNLSTALTVYLGSPRVQSGSHTQKKRDIVKSAPGTIRAVNRHLSLAPLALVDCTLGSNERFSPKCRFVLSTYHRESMRLAHMVSQTLFPTDAVARPEITVVMVPEWPEKERQVLVFPETGVTYILGTDYFGEAKNAFLRTGMWLAKQNAMLGLHAGTKILRARTTDGDLRRLGMLIFGIAATGKTTHSCHDHGLNGYAEGVEIVQDDVVFWNSDGGALGSERKFYIKTESLGPDSQPLLYQAAMHQDAILENVLIDYAGRVCFEDRSLTANGHGIVPRGSLGQSVCSSVNLPSACELDGLILAFMTRSYTAVPIASKLTPEQAAIAFVLSESIDASASDQQTPGTPTRGITASPFVIGEASEECNRFYEIVKSLGDRVECYMLNTGGVGERVEHGLDGARKVIRKVTRVQIPEMAAIIRAIARRTITWREDPDWMVDTPVSVDGLDITRFDLARHYDQDRIDALIAAIRLERADYAAQLRGLRPEIRAAAEF